MIADKIRRPNNNNTINSSDTISIHKIYKNNFFLAKKEK